MANEAAVPFLDQHIYLPVTTIQTVVTGMTHFSSPILFPRGAFIATALDIGIVSAVSSGYIQFYDAQYGNTIWVTEANAIETSYASWRGWYVKETNVAGFSDLTIFNNCTANIGVSLSGFFYRSSTVTDWMSDFPLAPT